MIGVTYFRKKRRKNKQVSIHVNKHGEFAIGMD